MATKKISQRKYTITTADDGVVLELGPPATDGTAGSYTIQVNPSVSFTGSLQVQGRIYGKAGDDLSLPFEPIPYRLLSLNGVASVTVNGQYPLVSDLISGAALIQVPAGGLSVGVLVSCAQSQCDLGTWGTEGSTAI